MIEQPLLSVVVTSYSSERLRDVFQLLDSLKNQTYANIEIVFVVERSEPLYSSISDYVQLITLQNTVILFSSDKLGLSGARNHGIKTAKGDIIAFVDDDVVLFNDWADEMIKTYKEDSIIGVTGPGFPKWEDEKMTWLPKEFYWIVSCTAFTGWNSPQPVRSAWGMNMSFRRQAFDNCLFSQDFGHTTGEKEAWKAGPVDDAEFSINLRLKTGQKIIYNPKVQVFHNVYKYRLEKRFVRGQCYWQGYTKGLLKQRYNQDPDIKTLARERDLLRRIITSVIPRAFAKFITKPRIASKELSFTAYTLFYVLLGYVSASVPFIGHITSKRYKS